MSLANGRNHELTELLDALCDERLSPAQAARLEELVLDDRQARRLYLDYIDLHGSLYWDAAKGSGSLDDLTAALTDAPFAFPTDSQSPTLFSETADTETVPIIATATPQPAAGRHRRPLLAVAVACALLLAGLLVMQTVRPGRGGPELAGDPEDRVVPAENGGADNRGTARSGDPAADTPRRPTVPEGGIPLVTRRPAGEGTPAPERPQPVPSVGPDSVAVPDMPTERAPAGTGSASPYVIAIIDEQLEAGWQDAGVVPSPAASDGEWVRRVYLDLVGHIPPAEVVEEFLKDRSPHKRTLLVERLLDEPAYVRNWTTIWTNLLIGRGEARGANRPAMQRFLRDGFFRNRPWSEMVVDFVAAEGSPDENGAATFLVAHLNNEAVPATAIAARLFLGTQVHCTQCHDHPHPANPAKQHDFWELNSFFQQTELVRRSAVDPRTGQRAVRTELVSRDLGGPIYFESRQGLMRAAFPRFAGEKVAAEPNVNRRRELGRLMLQGEPSPVARAMVNRMWEHFFGAGFTQPVDDMGPHNPPTHPELLDRLSQEFVRSGYDLKQLARWITGSRAYQLSSRFNEANALDDPEVGERPLFSRVYVKPMTAEQLYDSLLVATKAHLAGQSDWESAERRRQRWLRQFVIDLQNDENDEATTFDGTVQALMRMNGDLIEGAVSGSQGTFLHEVLAERSSETEKVRRLSLATLSRYPTSQEITAFRRLLREYAAGRGPQGKNAPQAAVQEGLKDLFWAYLNSGEFILVH